MEENVAVTEAFSAKEAKVERREPQRPEFNCKEYAKGFLVQTTLAAIRFWKL